MASLRITYWRDIPAMVAAKQGRKTAKRELPLRFTEAIDMAAMRSGAHDGANRREVTGGLDDTQLRNLEERLSLAEEIAASLAQITLGDNAREGRADHELLQPLVDDRDAGP